MNRKQFIKTCALLGLAIPPFTSITFSTFEYDAEAEALIDAMTKARAEYHMIVTDDEKYVIRCWVKSYKQSGIWQTLDSLYTFKDEKTAHINWIKP